MFLLGHKILVTELMAKLYIRNIKLLPRLIKHYSTKEYSVGVGVSSRHETEVSGHGHALAALPLLEGRACPRPSLIIGENHNPLDVQLVVLLVYKLSFSGL